MRGVGLISFSHVFCYKCLCSSGVCQWRRRVLQHVHPDGRLPVQQWALLSEVSGKCSLQAAAQPADCRHHSMCVFYLRPCVSFADSLPFKTVWKLFWSGAVLCLLDLAFWGRDSGQTEENLNLPVSDLRKSCDISLDIIVQTCLVFMSLP